MCVYTWGGAKPLLSCVTYILIMCVCNVSLFMCVCNVSFYMCVCNVSLFMFVCNVSLYTCTRKPYKHVHAMYVSIHM